jgi:protein gp37
MGSNSKIEWTHHTFNPWWGCVRVSPACDNCYAETWAKRVGMSDLWGKNAPRRFFSDAHWREPLKWDRDAAQAGERRRVFCASMADVFEPGRALNETRDRLWGVIEATPNLDWLLLTKRIKSVRTLAPWRGKWPANIWLGTSTENQRWLEKRVEHLLEHDAVVRFISAEPLLGPLNLVPWLASPGSREGGINWVIAGGESGAQSRSMNPVWPESIRDQCREANVPFHFKQWGHWAPEELIAEGISNRVQRINVEGRAGEIIRLVKVGKSKGGRELGGTTWDQVPELSF